jgi:hypothetical protein
MPLSAFIGFYRRLSASIGGSQAESKNQEFRSAQCSFDLSMA